MARANVFWPTAVVGEADSVNSVSASACHIGGPKGVSPGQKALLHGKQFRPPHTFSVPDVVSGSILCLEKLFVVAGDVIWVGFVAESSYYV